MSWGGHSVPDLVNGDDIPTCVHSLVLTNGRRMDIKINYDESKWRLEDSSPIDHLDELYLAFESSFHAPPSSVIFDLYIAPVTFKASDYKLPPAEHALHTIQVDTDGGVARFRLGSILATHLNRDGVFAERRSKQKLEMDNIFLLGTVTVRMNASSENFVHNLTFSREVDVQGESRSVPSEVLALHSPFLNRLFYGKVKRKEDSMKIEDMTGYEWDELCKILFMPSLIESVKRDLSWHLRMAQICDRFEMPHILQRVCTAAEEFIEETPFDFSSLDKLLEIVNIAEKFGMENTLMYYFFRRFPLNECLSDLHNTFANRFSPLSNRLLVERMNEITRLTRGRPKVLLQLESGGFIVELFNDLYDSIESHVQAVAKYGSPIVFSPLTPSIDPLFFSSSPVQFLCIDLKDDLYKLIVSPSTADHSTILGIVHCTI